MIRKPGCLFKIFGILFFDSFYQTHLSEHFSVLSLRVEYGNRLLYRQTQFFPEGFTCPYSRKGVTLRPETL